ncbi:uncharacterized protein BDZ83DRAFT_599201 [Colletotrichum acutatum]|uniref:Uncharacterized protein n=1 Tax=Glomerella acutata TaxID=27357 RepID=A0AAD8XP33_GLOAC|nr:uncharacterized protein BDZ83DRAFT_599201 [Colletotrichum acutatum]KAK1730924.1 hypothetical protein BDZ83DRAFT_599201 [Colletotrichum acutatum]
MFRYFASNTNGTVASQPPLRCLSMGLVFVQVRICLASQLKKAAYAHKSCILYTKGYAMGICGHCVLEPPDKLSWFWI